MLRYHKHPANIALHDRADQVDKAVGSFVAYFGSLRFIGWQTLVIIVWIVLNLVAYFSHWDPYPFILLNLVFSTQAAYAAPLVLMGQNRSAEHDRLRAEEAYRAAEATLEEIRALRTELASHGS